MITTRSLITGLLFGAMKKDGYDDPSKSSSEKCWKLPPTPLSKQNKSRSVTDYRFLGFLYGRCHGNEDKFDLKDMFSL